MKRLFILLAFIATSLEGFAIYNYLIDGIGYYLNTQDKTAQVAGSGSPQFENMYSGNVVIPEKITYGGVEYIVNKIWSCAFQYSPNLVSVTIPSSVTIIGNNAFKDCPRLTSVHIPNSVKSIEDEAFWGCSSLTSITIPNSVTSIGQDVFSGCGNITKVNVALKNEEDFVNYIQRNDIRSIFHDQFTSNPAHSLYINGEELTSVIIPNDITSIKSYAFKDCSNLTSVTIPSSVTSIGEKAFSGCSGLPVIDNVRYADTYLVEAVNKSLSSYSVRKGTRFIAEDAFKDCSNLTFVSIPSSVTSIGEKAFCGCSGLRSVNIPYNVTTIGASAFSGCSSLTSVDIPNCVTTIGASAFSGCSSLKTLDYNAINATVSTSTSSLSFPNTITTLKIGYKVKSIPAYFVYGCSGLTSVTIPSSVTSIGGNAFSECKNIAKVNVAVLDKYELKDYLQRSDIRSVFYDQFPYNPAHSIYITGEEQTSLIIPNSVTSIKDYAFKDCSNLTSVTIPSSVTSIGEKAFCGCSGLTTLNYNAKNATVSTSQSELSFPNTITTLTIDNSVESIPAYFLWGCEDLTSVTIPHSVTSIGENAFSGCSSLTTLVYNAKNATVSTSTSSMSFPNTITTLTIGNSVESIPAYFVYGCSDLTSVTIPNSVTSIGGNAFFECNYIDKVNVAMNNDEDLVNYIQRDDISSIFYDQFPYNPAHSIYITGEEQTSLIIPNSVTSIKDYAFKDCSNLTSVTIPSSVTSIGEKAFCGCYSLSSVTIPNSVDYILEKAFCDCSSLSSVTIPNSVDYILKNAFSGCSSLTTLNYNAKNATVSTSQSELSFPNTITTLTIGNSVESIPAYFVYGCSDLTSVTIPNSVTSIGGNAFSECDYIDKVNVTMNNDEDFIRYIQRDDISSIFYDKFPSNSVHSIYINGEELTSLIIPNSITSIKDYAFKDCSNLTSVTIPSSVTSIGGNAFSECENITKVNVALTNDEDFVNYVKRDDISSIFYDQFPSNSVHSIYINGAELTSVIIPNDITSIKSSSFKTCVNLTSVTIPCSVTSLGENAFWGCGNIAKVNVALKNEEDVLNYLQRDDISSIFYDQFPSNSVHSIYVDGEELTSIIIPNSIMTINSCTFKNCSALTSVTIPNSVTKIENEAFYGCTSMASVTIPKNVTSIKDGVFYGCTGLKTIYSKNPTPPAADNTTFANVMHAKCKVYVPKGSKDAYDWADVWTDFFNIIETTTMDDLTPGTDVLNLTDANPSLTPGIYDANNIRYSTNVSENKYATFCLPFHIDLADYTDIFSKVYVPHNTGYLKPDGTLLLMLEKKPMTETILAGTPFLAYGCSNGTVVFKNSQVTEINDDMPAPDPIKLSIYNVSGTSGTLSQNTNLEVRIGGTYEKLTGLDSNHYRAFTTTGTFGPTEWLNPFRMYVYKDDGQSQARILNLSLSMEEDETTLIERINAESEQSSQYIYNLQGQRVNSPQDSGLYIINGKKVIK